MSTDERLHQPDWEHRRQMIRQLGLPANELRRIADQLDKEAEHAKGQGGAGQSIPTDTSAFCLEAPRFNNRAAVLKHLFTYHRARPDQQPRYEAINRACLRFAEDILDALPTEWNPEVGRVVEAIQFLRMDCNRIVALDGLQVINNLQTLLTAK